MSENSDIFNTRGQIFLVFTKKGKTFFLFYTVYENYAAQISLKKNKFSVIVNHIYMV